VQPVRLGVLAEGRRSARLSGAFVDALTKAGWMSALIPEEYGGSGLSLTEASVIMEEITQSGGNAGCCHGQMYNMNTLLRHGSIEQKKKFLPKIATGELRLQSMGVTEPTAGTGHHEDQDRRVKKGDRYVVNGQKVWTSRLQHSELMILLARTTPLDEVKKKVGRHVDLPRRQALGAGEEHDAAADPQHGEPRDRTRCSSTTSRSRPRT
jgi:alkylation response protein AidB-like acyl-CoA dehydrogenase